ncbi:MAG: hypothetical protein KDE57_10455 [Calditrichaeota bacterium]|nr:hypothetical protein [Calditrichota bacterium]
MKNSESFNPQQIKGLVWRTANNIQARQIKNALEALRILCEIQQDGNAEQAVYLLIVPNPADVPRATDFIWRDEFGLQLKSVGEMPQDYPLPKSDNNH